MQYWGHAYFKYWASLVAQTVESTCSAEDLGSIPGLGRREWQPTPVLLPGEFHGQRSLAG